MAHGDFIWCDLSTFNVARTQAFYADAFGWSYTTIQQPDGSDYHLAKAGGSDAAAIFEMPDKFQKIGLPSFWMTYIQVDDAAATAQQATALGGKVELGPIPFSDNGQIALIRDPLGAGFTVYDGTDMPPHAKSPKPGHPIWHGLYVSEAKAVTPFYETLFGWNIRATQPGSYDLMRNGTIIGGLEELAEEIRGTFEFWGVHCATTNFDRALAKTAPLTQFDRNGARTALLKDPDGAAFFIEETTRTKTDLKWKTLLALALLWIAVALDQSWVWGVLFLFWTALALQNRETFLVERIGRDTQAALYWLIIGSWLILSLLAFFYA